MAAAAGRERCAPMPTAESSDCVAKMPSMELNSRWDARHDT